MNRNIIMAVAILLRVSGFAQTVSNVTVIQVEKTIHVSYDLDVLADVTLFLSTDGGRNYTELHQVRGHVGENVLAGHNTIVWNVLAEQESLVGEDVMFKVRAITQPRDGKPCPGTPTLKDYDGNTYHTVQIGKQCWMKENLRTTHYADGTNISLGRDRSTTAAYRYYPDNSSSNVATYGYLYNWKAVMHNSSSSNGIPSGVQGVCPKGWHVPSHAEWSKLVDYLKKQSLYVCKSGSKYGNDIAKSMACTVGWDCSDSSCEVGNVPEENNSTGFTAVPASYFFGYNRAFLKCGYAAAFWTSTENGDSHAKSWVLTSDNSSVFWGDNFKYDGYSVRCLKD